MVQGTHWPMGTRRKGQWAQPTIGGVDGALFHNPLLGHMRDNQMLEERRGVVAVLCVLAVAGIYTAGLAVWGLFALCGWA